MSYTGTVIVIPTRNRADLARNASSSVLGQSDCEVDVLVSDNSTSTQQRTELSQYCQQSASRRLRYIIPPEPLPMSQHWDWVIRQALSLYDASHFTFLTDRMMFKPGALKRLVEIVAAYPDKILTYMHDQVDDFLSPVVLHQYTWTGNLYEVSSAHLLGLSAESVMYDTAMPRMLNCIAPRQILKAIDQRFGNIFASISPDWNFCYHALDVTDSILFYDKAALVHYAQRRSNGQSVHFGVANEAFTDFVKDLGGSLFYNDAPFPEIMTVWNAIISEYCHAKQVTQGLKFPEVNLDKYMQALAFGIGYIKDPQRREHMRALLSAHGWKPQEAPSTPAPPPPTNDDPTSEVESFSVNNLEFQSSKEALDHALSHARLKATRSDHERLIHGLRVPLPEAACLEVYDSTPPGVNLIAYIRAEMGLGTAARGIALALESANVPFNIINFEYLNPSLHRDTTWMHKEADYSSHDFTILAVNPDNIFNAKDRAQKEFVRDRYTIGYWSWELPEIPDGWLSAFSLVDEVWAASRFVQDSISLKSPVPVFRVPVPVRLGPTDKFSRGAFSLPERQFLFLSMSDTHSQLERKNPLGVVRAFKRAFPGDNKSVGLILKINNLNSVYADRDAIALIREEISGHQNIYLLDCDMTRTEIDSLLAVSDCFISLHRSEGFGLGPAEAMSLGKPVILTNWSGNTDYMTPNNSIGINYQLIPVGKQYGPYQPDQLWAEPDLEHAAFWMKHVAKDTELANRIGMLGQQTIRSEFSPEAIGKLILKRLNYLKRTATFSASY